MTHPTPATLHAWGDEWHRRKLALSRQRSDGDTQQRAETLLSAIHAEYTACWRRWHK